PEPEYRTTTPSKHRAVPLPPLIWRRIQKVPAVDVRGVMSAKGKNVLQKTPSKTDEEGEMTAESLQLKHELQTLRQVHSSIKALDHMTLSLQKSLESVAKNSKDLKNLNEGWKIFFGQG
ncbi:hypothetical protein GDO78_014997, partial [Eleutherodactylus coqui]